MCFVCFFFSLIFFSFLDTSLSIRGIDSFNLQLVFLRLNLFDFFKYACAYVARRIRFHSKVIIFCFKTCDTSKMAQMMQKSSERDNYFMSFNVVWKNIFVGHSTYVSLTTEFKSFFYLKMNQKSRQARVPNGQKPKNVFDNFKFQTSDIIMSSKLQEYSFFSFVLVKSALNSIHK